MRKTSKVPLAAAGLKKPKKDKLRDPDNEFFIINISNYLIDKSSVTHLTSFEVVNQIEKKSKWKPYQKSP